MKHPVCNTCDEDALLVELRQLTESELVTRFNTLFDRGAINDGVARLYPLSAITSLALKNADAVSLSDEDLNAVRITIAVAEVLERRASKGADR